MNKKQDREIKMIVATIIKKESALPYGGMKLTTKSGNIIYSKLSNTEQIEVGKEYELAFYVSNTEKQTRQLYDFGEIENIKDVKHTQKSRERERERERESVGKIK